MVWFEFEVSRGKIEKERYRKSEWSVCILGNVDNDASEVYYAENGKECSRAHGPGGAELRCCDLRLWPREQTRLPHWVVSSHTNS